ncbi:MAG: hypothetical protein K8T26_10255 [Lentisphaerae bacterium]|nr:hypothetical protein [Lentisphaerota bacterium]
MEHKNQPDQQPARMESRLPYEPPRLQVVELLPEETLGIGCKTQAEPLCGQGFNFGS